MLTAVVIEVEALNDGSLSAATGRFIHGFWFHQWAEVDPARAKALHAGEHLRPYTLSPLMGLPHPRHGKITVEAGARAWLRMTTLTSALSDALLGDWLPQLPDMIRLGGISWEIKGHTLNSTDSPWAGQVDAQDLTERHLLAEEPHRRWTLRFATPTAFHGAAGHLPFPLPGALIGSWLRQWQSFSKVHLPENLPEKVHEGLVISAYRLKTVPVRDRKRITIGCVGDMTLYGKGLSKPICAAVDLLAHYALWAGSGHRTTQGHGMTRLHKTA